MSWEGIDRRAHERADAISIADARRRSNKAHILAIAALVIAAAAIVVGGLGNYRVYQIDRHGQARDAAVRRDTVDFICGKVDAQNVVLVAILARFDPDRSSRLIQAAIEDLSVPACPVKELREIGVTPSTTTP